MGSAVGLRLDLLPLCYDTLLLMLLFFSLVTYQAKTYNNNQNNRICSLRIMDHISRAFLT